MLRRVSFPTLAGCLLVQLVTAAMEKEPFILDRTGDRYDLNAVDAPLSEILQSIDRQERTSLRFLDTPDRRVSCRYRGLTLDALLDRLGVNYVLIYEPAADGMYRIDDGWLLGRDATALAPARVAAIRRAIAQLRDDDVRYNALAARHELWDEACESAAFLEEALLSSDYQQRQVAAELLTYCASYTPSESFLGVLLQRLRRSDFDPGMADLATPGGAFEYLRNATNVYYRIKSKLVANLRSDDPQERLFSALILAEHGERDHAATLAPLLVPHLADNAMPRDGGLAAYALHRLGESARGTLAPLRDSADAQQADLARLLVHQLDHPDARDGELENFFFNTTVRNPVLERTSHYGYWDLADFPDEHGRYAGREEPEEWMEEGDACAPLVEQTAEFLPYTVKPGETLAEISRLFIVATERLVAVNALSFAPDALLPVGMVLRIPAPEF